MLTKDSSKIKIVDISDPIHRLKVIFKNNNATMNMSPSGDFTGALSINVDGDFFDYFHSHITYSELLRSNKHLTEKTQKFYNEIISLFKHQNMMIAAFKDTCRIYKNNEAIFEIKGGRNIKITDKSFPEC